MVNYRKTGFEREVAPFFGRNKNKKSKKNPCFLSQEKHAFVFLQL